MDTDEERRLAAGLFNHTGRYHWRRAGEPVPYARGEWQCSRVYAVLGRSEPALHHARALPGAGQRAILEGDLADLA